MPEAGDRRLQAHAAAVQQGDAATSGQATASEEVKKAFTRVQNGADIRGVVLDGVEGEDISLTPLMVFFIARGYVTWLAEKKSVEAGELRIAIGADSRLSGLTMRASFEAGAASLGARVSNCGLATTPAMFFACIASGHSYSGGVMITASHLPFNRNGMKFFTSAGGLNAADITWMLQRATDDCAAHGMAPHDPRCDPGHVIDAARQADSDLVDTSRFMDAYAASLRSAIVTGVEHPDTPEQPLQGMKILVDAGNGAGGFFASDVLARLGADTTGSQFLDPDGTFPNHVPNPEDRAAMSATIDAVLTHDAELGVVFDTDVDRSGVVDANGRAVNKNKLIALMAAVTLRDAPGSTVVTDSVTSSGLTAFIEAHGGKHLRFKRGYKNVINKGIELNKGGEHCELMMETSGHGALKQNHYLDDGAYMAVKIIIEAARRRHQGKPGISDILEELDEPAESAEVRLKIKADDFKRVADNTVDAFTAWLADGAGGAWQLDEPNFEGVRVKVMGKEGQQTGWALLRASLHDPLLVINAESDAKGGVGDIFRRIRKFMTATSVATCDTETGQCVNECVDISPLNDYC